MAPTTRNFLIGSSLIVVVGLCTGLVAYYGDNLSGRGVRESDLQYIPADVTAVAYADVRDIMNSPFHQKLRQVLPSGEGKNEFVEETGIDVDKDIDTVVAGFAGTGPNDGRAVVILRGRFDQARIEGLATRSGAVAETYNSMRLLAGLGNQAPAPRPDGTPRPVPALAFLGDGVLALGDVEGLKRAIDASGQGQDITSNPEAMRMVAGVENAGNAWMVGRVSALGEAHDLPEEVRSRLGGLDWIALSANIDSGVNAMLRAEARDDKSGQELRSILNGALAAARMFGGQDPRVEAALNTVRSSGSGRNVEVSFSVPAELIDLMGQAHMREMAPAPVPPVPPAAPVPPALP